MQVFFSLNLNHSMIGLNDNFTSSDVKGMPVIEWRKNTLVLTEISVTNL